MKQDQNENEKEDDIHGKNDEESKSGNKKYDNRLYEKRINE